MLCISNQPLTELKANHELRIAKFQMNGFNKRILMLSDLLNSMDFVVMQEYRLQNCNFLNLEGLNNDLELHSSMNQNSTMVSQPYG